VNDWGTLSNANRKPVFLSMDSDSEGGGLIHDSNSICSRTNIIFNVSKQLSVCGKQMQKVNLFKNPLLGSMTAETFELL